MEKFEYLKASIKSSWEELGAGVRKSSALISAQEMAAVLGGPGWDEVIRKVSAPLSKEQRKEQGGYDVLIRTCEQFSQLAEGRPTEIMRGILAAMRFENTVVGLVREAHEDCVFRISLCNWSNFGRRVDIAGDAWTSLYYADFVDMSGSRKVWEVEGEGLAFHMLVGLETMLEVLAAVHHPRQPDILDLMECTRQLQEQMRSSYMLCSYLLDYEHKSSAKSTNFTLHEESSEDGVSVQFTVSRNMPESARKIMRHIIAALVVERNGTISTDVDFDESDSYLHNAMQCMGKGVNMDLTVSAAYRKFLEGRIDVGEHNYVSEVNISERNAALISRVFGISSIQDVGVKKCELDDEFEGHFYESKFFELIEEPVFIEALGVQAGGRKGYLTQPPPTTKNFLRKGKMYTFTADNGLLTCTSDLTAMENVKIMLMMATNALTAIMHGSIAYEDFPKLKAESNDSTALTELLLSGKFGPEGTFWVLSLVEYGHLHLAEERRGYFERGPPKGVTKARAILPRKIVQSMEFLTDGKSLFYRWGEESYARVETGEHNCWTMIPVAETPNVIGRARVKAARALA